MIEVYFNYNKLALKACLQLLLGVNNNILQLEKVPLLVTKKSDHRQGDTGRGVRKIEYCLSTRKRELLTGSWKSGPLWSHTFLLASSLSSMEGCGSRVDLTSRSLLVVPSFLCVRKIEYCLS